jgi:hypothetical protein
MRAFSSLLVLFFALALSGCVEKVTAPFTGPPVNRDEESFAEFRDVPYPAHLRFNKNVSFTYQRRGVLSGLVQVEGTMTVDELGAYCDAHLPGHGWKPISDIQYSSALVSTWKKADKILTVVGRPSSLSTLSGGLNVQLWVAPPYTEDDLGQRVIYRKKDPSSSGGILDELFSTGSGSKKSGGSMTEEDIQ